MDCDLQDPPEVIPDLVEKWIEGNQVVYARRRERTDGAFKKATARFYYRLLGRFADVDIPRDVGDFRLVDRAVLTNLLRLDERARYLRGMVAAGIAVWVDGVGVHPYGFANPPGERWDNPTHQAPSHNNHPSFFFRDTLEDYRAILVTAGIEAVPLWVTDVKRGLFRNRVMWAGFGLAMTLRLLTLVSVFFPAFPMISLAVRYFSFVQMPWRAAGGIPISSMPFSYGLAYLLPLPVLRVLVFPAVWPATVGARCRSGFHAR